jgi:putative ABC transport system permease protein
VFFRYIIRNLIARREAVLPAALAIMAAVGVTTAMLGLLEGLQKALYESGPRLNAIVTSKGVDDEFQTAFPYTTIAQIAVQPGIAKSANGSPMISPEFVSLYRFRSAKGFQIVTLRGVDPIALEIHSGVRIEGAFPKPGEQGLVVGSHQLGAIPGFQLGSKVRIGKSQWTVTGVLHAPGTIFDSEVWTDRVALQTEFQRPNTVSVAYVRLTDLAALGPLDAAISRDKTADVSARFERDFKAANYGSSVSSFIKGGLAITLLLGVAAVFTATNTLFALYLGKITELGTLIALGYTRRRVVMLLLEEALLIAFGSGGLGIVLALLSNGHLVSFEGLSLVFSEMITPRVLGAGALATLLIGVLAAIAISVNAWRLDVLDALRS